MKTHRVVRIVVAAGITSLAVGVAVARQDTSALKAPNGVAYSEFKGFDGWATVAPSATDDGIKSIVANPTMMAAYKSGVPGNGKPFPDGAMIAKIEWAKVPNPDSPYAVLVPGALKSVSFIEKDSKRFAATNGWGYAQFKYDAASHSLKPGQTDPAFGKTLCHDCHTAVKAQDYIFTKYAPR